MNDILQPENLLPTQAQSLDKVKEDIEGQNSSSIYPVKNSWTLQKILNIDFEVTCVKYVPLPSIKPNEYITIPYMEGEHTLAGLQGLWLGGQDGTISIYSPVTKKITRSVFKFENKLKNLMYIDSYDLNSENNFCFVIACSQNGDIGIMSFYEKRAGTHFFSHNLGGSRIKKILHKDFAIYILTEDKKLNVYQLAFNLENGLETVPVTHKRVEAFDEIKVQGSIEDFYLNWDDLNLVSSNQKDSTLKVRTQKLKPEYRNPYEDKGFGIRNFYFGMEDYGPALAEGAYPCIDFPKKYFFQQNTDILECYDKPEERIQLPFKIEKSLITGQPKIHIGNVCSFVSYLSEGTLKFYASSDIKKGQYDDHKILKNIKFNVFEEGMIMAVTQNNDLEIYEYRGTTQKLYGFNGQISCLSISDDGNYCAYAGQKGLIGIKSLNEKDEYLEIFNVKDLKLKPIKYGSKGDQSDCENEKKITEIKNGPEYQNTQLCSIQFLDQVNLDLLVVGFDDCIRRIATSEKMVEWEKFMKHQVISVLVSGKEIIVGLINGLVYIYDFNGKKIFKHNFKSTVNEGQKKLACTSDNNLIIYAMKTDIRVYNRHLKTEYIFLQYQGTIPYWQDRISIEVSQDNKTLVIFVDKTKNVMVYSLETKQKISQQTLKKKESESQPDLGILIQNQKYISFWQYNNNEIYDITTGNYLLGLQGEPSEKFNAVAASKDGRIMIGGTSSGVLKVYNISPLFELPMANLSQNPMTYSKPGEKNHEGKDEHEIYAVARSEDQELLAVEMGSFNRCLIVYNKKKERVYQIKVPLAREKTHIFFTRDNKFMIRAFFKDFYKINLESKEVIKVNPETFQANLMEFDSRSLLLYTLIISEPAIKIYSLEQAFNPETFKDLTSIPEYRIIPREGKANPVFMKLSPDGSLLAVLTHYKDIEIYNTTTLQLVNFIHKEAALSQIYFLWVEDMVISHDNKYIAAFYQKKVHVYHINTQQQLDCGFDYLGGKEYELDSEDLFFPKTKSGLVFSKNGKYVVAFLKSKIDVLDIEAKKVILSCQPFNAASNIIFVDFSLDRNSLLVVSNKRQIRNIAFPLNSYQCPVIYDKVPAYSILEKTVFEDMIKELKTTEDTSVFASRFKHVYLCPQRWTFLHLFAIYRPDDINKVVETPDIKFPFLVDSFGKTPLHYMLAHSKINYVAVNAVIKYIIEYLSSIEDSNPPEFHQIINSLSGILPMFFNQINHSVVLKFLKCNVNNAYYASDESIPLFGKSNDHPVAINSLSISKENIDQMYDSKDNKMIGFKSMSLNLDYNPISEDMLNTCIALQQCDNEEFFKTPAVSTLIDYLWNSHFNYLLFQTFIFSILMIITSVYIGRGESELGFEITILVFGGLFFAMELIQVFKYGIISYYSSLWNVIDLLFCVTLSGTMIARIAGLEEGLARAWLFTVILLSGYLKWIIHFRIFGATRKLIRIVIEIIKGMVSFIAILIFIIFALSLILLEFDRETEFTDHLLSGYGFIYGDYETEDVSSSEIAIMVFVAFLVSVVLLNLLIAMMGDSYAKVDEISILVDSLERLDMIVEVIVMKRIFTQKELVREKSYLMFCQNSVNGGGDDDEENLLEEKTNLLQKAIKTVETQMVQNSSNLTSIEEKMKILAKAQEDNFTSIDEKIKALTKSQAENSAQMKDMMNLVKQLLETQKKQ